MAEVPPILEFDPDRTALIDPRSEPPIPGAPVAAVACFFPELIDQVAGAGQVLRQLPSMGDLWKIDYEGEPLAVFSPGQGASLAAVTVERVLAAGIEVIVACGGAGAVVADLALGHVVVVDAAVRDEGTSYHYLPPSRELTTPSEVVDVLRDVVRVSGLAYTVGKTWTTDGFFRETRGRIRKRRDEGCVVVEAEAAALLAVGQFRDVPIGQFLFAGDDVSGAAVDDRGWRTAHDIHMALFDLAARSALRLARG
jgi:uridine phosphorylase